MKKNLNLSVKALLRRSQVTKLNVYELQAETVFRFFEQNFWFNKKITDALALGKWEQAREKIFLF